MHCESGEPGDIKTLFRLSRRSAYSSRTSCSKGEIDWEVFAAAVVAERGGVELEAGFIDAIAEEAVK